MGHVPNGIRRHELHLLSAGRARDARARAEEGHVGTADRVVGIALVVALLGAAGPARAALGEPESSVERDGSALAMERQAARAQAGGVTVHELRRSTQAVREYADRSGTVFAVAWSGSAAPDFPKLLGAYYDEYRAAAARPITVRGPRRVEAGRVVVETWGHGRDLHGRAWIPAHVPQGASLDDVK